MMSHHRYQGEAPQRNTASTLKVLLGCLILAGGGWLFFLGESHALKTLSTTPPQTSQSIVKAPEPKLPQLPPEKPQVSALLQTNNPAVQSVPAVAVNAAPVVADTNIIQKQVWANPSAPAKNTVINDQRREEIAQSLRSMGCEVDWQKCSYSEMFEIETRVKKAVALNMQFKWNLNWKDHSYQELCDFENRANKADMLNQQFKWNLDWRKYSLAQMNDFESRATRANSLKQRGVTVDWRQHTDRELYEMQHQAEFGSY